MRRALATTVLLMSIALGGARTADADKASGTWTGQVDARGNYYWERSTRVVAPQIAAQLEAPNGVRARASYLLDAITSASVAAGTLVDRRFTETRHDVGLGGGYEFELSSAQLELGLDGRVSTEPDYLSRSGTLSSTLWLNERSTGLQLTGTYLVDDVKTVLRGAAGASAAQDVGQLRSVVLGANWIQALSPIATVTFGYDFASLTGFLQNPYRSVSLGAAPVPEKHPARRLRHTVYGRFELYSPHTDTAFHGLLRLYGDSWDIRAVTPEARIYQNLTDDFMLRLRYRFYSQTAAAFWESAYEPTDTFHSADPKMAAFRTHLLGTQLYLPLRFLDGSWLGFASRASLDVSFEYLWSTSAFGDATIAQGGLSVPF